MKFVDLARKRCSIRSFKPDPIPEEVLDEILQAANLAPTAKNLQPFHFIVVRDEAQLDSLAESYPAPFFREAPVVIAICTEPAKAWVRERYDGKNYGDVDAAIAVDHMTLAAADRDLGTCWIGAFDPAGVKKTLGLPDGVEPIALLPIGYPNTSGRPKQRKDIRDLVRYNHW